MTRHSVSGRTRGVIVAALFVSLAMPAAALAQSGLSTKAEPPATKPMDLPAAEDLFARHVEAMGGEKALRKVTSMHVIGKFDMAAQGISGAEMHVYRHAPNKSLVMLEIPGMGLVRRGYDGKVGWSIDPNQGPSLVEGDELLEMVEESDFYGELNYRKRYKSMETVDRMEFNGHDCYVVKVMTVHDRPRTIYFDADSGFQTGMIAKTETQMGTLNSTTILEEYTQFGDLQYPVKTTTKLPDMGMEQSFMISEVVVNKVNASEFKLPDEIKALLKSEDQGATTRPDKPGRSGGKGG